MKNLKEIKIKPAFPFPAYRIPVFYGWVILALGSVSFLMTIPGQTVGVSVFTDFLMQVLNLTRTSLSLAYFIGTIMSAFILTFAGKLYDRLGDRILGTTIAICLGLILFILSKVDKTLATLTGIITWLPPQVIAFVLISLGFFALRFLGQGVLALVSRNIVMKWFNTRRGFANAILGTCISFGMAYTPRLLNDLINAFEWNGAWDILSKVIGIAFALCFFLLARDTPKECGLEPDGNLKKEDQNKANTEQTTRDYTLREALHTFTFWPFALTTAIFALYMTAITFHIVSLFNESGMDRNMAVSIFLPVGIISVIVNFVASWASDFIKLKYFLIFELIGMSLSMFAVINLAPGYAVILLIIGNGISNGLFGLLSTIVWPKYYGIKNLGAISSLAMGFVVGGSAVGPYLFSISLKYAGTYGTACLVLLFICIILLIIGFKAEKPAS